MYRLGLNAVDIYKKYIYLYNKILPIWPGQQSVDLNNYEGIHLMNLIKICGRKKEKR